MKRQLVMVWLVVPGLVGLAAFSARHAVPELSRRAGAWAGSSPVLDCPDAIDLGEQPFGQTAVGRVVVRNAGADDLLIDDVSSSCVCLGLEREQAGRFERIESVLVAPGVSEEFVTRLAVRGRAGDPFGHRLTFRTNDPSRPRAEIGVKVSRVSGGLLTSPSTVAFDAVPVGTEATQVVEVFDGSAVERQVARVTTTHPALATTMIPVNGGHQDSRGRLVARVEVSVRSNDPAAVSGDVYLFLTDEPTRSYLVPVSARFVGLVEVIPAALVLPKPLGGSFANEGTCLCRCPSGRPLRLDPESAPPDLRVSVSDAAGQEAAKMVRVEWVSADAPKGLRPDQSRTVRLRARVGELTTPVEIPVYCRGTGE